MEATEDDNIAQAVNLLKQARQNLIKKGKTLKEVNETMRKAQRQVGQVESIDLEDPNLPSDLQSMEPEFELTDQLILIPHGETIQGKIKQEIEDGNPSNHVHPYKAWWKKRKVNDSSSAESVNLLEHVSSPLPDGQRLTDSNGEPFPSENETGKSPIIRKRKRKIPISQEFCDISNASFTSNPKEDINAVGATEIFKVFCMRPDRRSALILEVSQLDSQGAVIFSDRYDDEAKKRRQSLVERVKKTIQDSVCTENSEHMTQLLRALIENPESFFRVMALTNTLHKQGITDPKEVAARISYDEELGKAVIIDKQNAHEDFELCLDNLQNNKTISMMIKGFESHLSNTMSPSFVSSIRGNDSESRTSTPTLLGSAAFNFEPSPILPPAHKRTNRSVQNRTADESSLRKVQPVGMKNLEEVEMDEIQFKAMHKDSNRFIELIIRFPYSDRLPIHKWKKLINQKEIKAPTPLDYHHRYAQKPSFLSLSFQQEALPGIYRPCSSKWDERQALIEFEKEHGREPDTLVEMNRWVKSQHPPVIPSFEPKKFPLEVEGYNLELFGEMAPYDLARKGASLNNPTQKQHTPRNLITAKRFISLNQQTLGPLEPFIADPMLCTLGPSIMTRTKYHWYSVPVPQHEGDLVVKDILFEHNACSFPIITNQTMIGSCGVCNGLLALPDYITYLAYFWPKDLKPENVTQAIKEVWQNQRIAVCWIHVVSEGRLIEGRKL